MELSIFLAKIIGVVYVVAGISVLFNAKYFKALLNDLLKDRVWIFTMGLIGLVVTFIWVLKHNIWQGPWWVILVTLFGWLGFIKTLFMLIFPEWFEKLSLAFVKWINVKALWGVFGLGLGLLFSYIGWMV